MNVLCDMHSSFESGFLPRGKVYLSIDFLRKIEQRQMKSPWQISRSGSWINLSYYVSTAAAAAASAS